MSVRAEAAEARDGPVANRVQRACDCATTGETCAECAAAERRRVQPKLRLGTPGDRWEREADRIADELVADRPTPLTGPLPVTPLVQMQEDEDEEEIGSEENEEELRAKGTGAVAPAPAVARAAAAVEGGGRPLSRSERAWFEPRLGRDLSPVRVHEDAAAGAAASGIRARAYTLRHHIAFAPGAYDAGSTEGRRLMAHELVHTLQQNGRGRAVVRRQPSARCATFMRSPTPSDVVTGQLVEREVVAHFEARYGDNQASTLPDASFGPYRTGTRRSQPKQVFGGKAGTGRPDLALRSRGGQVMLLAEIKPANLSEFINGEAQLLNYINKGNSKDNQPVRDDLGIRVFSPMIRVGTRYATPRYVSFGGRRFRVMWCGPGVIVYKELGRKRRRKRDQRRTDRRTRQQTTRRQRQPTRRPGRGPGRAPRGARMGAYNFGLGLSILSTGGGVGNVGIGVSILSEGISVGTVSAGIVYNSQGVAVGTLGAGAASDSQIAAALSAGLGTAKESSVAGLATAGAGEIEGVTGAEVAAAGAGTRSGGEKGAEAEAPAGRAETGEAAGTRGRDPAAVEAALQAAAGADRAIRAATDAQRRFLAAMIARTEGGLYVVPEPEFAARLLAAVEGATEEELEYLATLTWRPSRSSVAELRRQVRRALARRGAQGGSAGPAEPAEKRPPTVKKPEGAGAAKAGGGKGEKKAAGPSGEEQQKRREYIENLRDRARAFDLASHPEGAVVYDNPKEATTTGKRVKATLYFPMSVESGEVVAACDVVGVREGSGKDLTFEVLEAGPVVTAEGEVFENSAPLVGRPISIGDVTPESQP